jgi:hypothetical protein
VLAALLAGCAQVPPAKLATARFDYGQEIAESWKRQALMNVVRLRYNDAPAFLDVSGVVTSDSLSTKLNAGPTFAQTVGDSKLDLGVSGTWTSAPTVTFSPIGGERFSKRLLEPLSPIAVLMLVQSGWPIDLVWPATVTSINGLHGQSLGLPADQRFVELQETLNRMQRSHSVGFRVRQEEGRDGVLMVLHREHVPQAAADVAKMRTLLGLKPDASQFSVTLGELPRNDRELAINTRSMLELMQELGAGIVVPPEHQRKARMLRDASTDPNELTQSDTYRPLVEIKSGRTPPAETYAAVQYKGYWFWIDDEDDRTKRLFTFLMILFSLSETSPPMSNPVLSINTGR